MIFWLVPVAISVVFLAWFLLRALRQYDQESVGAALDRISEMEKSLETIQERLIVLETIESDLIINDENSKEIADSAESLSLGRRPLIE